MIFANESLPLLEMARIGCFDNLELIVHTDDPVNIPHFHIRDKNTGGKEFHCCIRIDKADYFIHTGKENKLNSRLKKNLVKFLQTESNFGSIKLKNWDKVLMYWNDNNSDIILDSSTVMPDYTKLS